MMDEGDEGARVGLWATLGIITLLLFGLIGGLALRQQHKAAQAKAPVLATTLSAPVLDAVATSTASAADTTLVPAQAALGPNETLIDAPLSGELLDQVYFDVASTSLAPAAAGKLAAVTTALDKAGPGARLILSGFHDASGDPAVNRDLARSRSIAVREALKAAGVPEARVALRRPEETTGGGSPESARRVEIRLVK